MADDIEATPIANVAFTGVVADEINRLNREIKGLRTVIGHVTRVGLGPVVNDAIGHGCAMCTKALRIVEEDSQ